MLAKPFPTMGLPLIKWMISLVSLRIEASRSDGFIRIEAHQRNPSSREAKHFLGIRIVRDRAQRKLWLVQDSYIDKMAEKFNITKKKLVKVPGRAAFTPLFADGFIAAPLEYRC
jgi:hypothetical protein